MMYENCLVENGRSNLVELFGTQVIGTGKYVGPAYGHTKPVRYEERNGVFLPWNYCMPLITINHGYQYPKMLINVCNRTSCIKNVIIFGSDIQMDHIILQHDIGAFGAIKENEYVMFQGYIVQYKKKGGYDLTIHISFIKPYNLYKVW